jgi:hypothetical protein
MRMKINKIALTEKQSYGLLFMVSLLISAVIIYFKPFINRDGIYYLEAAARAQTWSISEMKAYDHWPFYAYTLKLLSAFSTLSLAQVAYLINSLAIASLIIIVLKLSKQLTHADTSQLAVLTLILLSFSEINEMRGEILREPIGLACLFASIIFLAKYVDNKKSLYLTLWLSALILSSLYRLEFLAYIVLVPSYFLVYSSIKYSPIKTLKHYIFLSIILITLCALFIATLFCIKHYYLSGAKIGRLREYLHAIKYFSNAWHSHINALRENILPVQAFGEAKLYLLGGIFAVFLFKIISNLPILAIIALFLTYISLNIKQNTRVGGFRLHSIWPAYFITSITIVAYTISKNLFIPNRILLPTTLLLLIPATKYIRPPSRLNYKALLIASLIITLSLPKIIQENKSIKYQKLKQVIKLIRSNNPECLVSNLNQIAYYSGFDTESNKFFGLIYEKHINENDNLMKVRNKQIPKCSNLIAALKIKSPKEIDYLNNFFSSTPKQFIRIKGDKGFIIYRLNTMPKAPHQLAYNHNPNHAQQLHK